MVTIFGKRYYIDADAITKQCSTKSNVEEENESTIEINIFKFEVLKMCIETVLTSVEEVDEGMGDYSQNNMSVPFKLAFNTLIMNEILISLSEDE